MRMGQATSRCCLGLSCCSYLLDLVLSFPFIQKSIVHRLKLFSALLVVTVASGCASIYGTGDHTARKVPSPGSASGSNSSVKSTAPASPAPTAKGGGYYDRDGPPEVSPADLALIADAVPRVEAIMPSANRPYVVFGQRYEPMTRRTNFTQNGTASWYGKQFHGRKTSSGEVYDMLAMTAAHPTLPIPSYVRVTNQKNGRQVIVRVNDRGPFLHNRAIDLSYAAATKLGYTASGHTQVSIELLLSEGATEAEPVLAQHSATVKANSVEARSADVKLSEIKPNEPSAASPSATPLSLSMSVVSAVDPVSRPVVSSENPPKKPVAGVASNSNNVFLQLGAFSNRDNAEAVLYKVARLLPESEGMVNLEQSDQLIRLRMGPMTALQADIQAERVEKLTGTRPIRIFSKQ